MTEIRVLIADDEPLARRGVSQLLAGHSDMRVVGEARDGDEAVRMIRALKPDLLFLDVQMPGNDGFHVLARIATNDVPAVIFLTAYEEFAARAFDVDAVDYVVKPPSRQRFERAIARARKRLDQHRLDPANLSVGIRVETASGTLILRPDEVDWIEAADYCAVVHALGGRHLVRESLDALEERLPASLFVRTHRSALVNLARVRGSAPDTAGNVLLLTTGAHVPVSRRRRRAVLERLRAVTT